MTMPNFYHNSAMRIPFFHSPFWRNILISLDFRPSLAMEKTLDESVNYFLVCFIFIFVTEESR